MSHDRPGGPRATPRRGFYIRKWTDTEPNRTGGCRLSLRRSYALPPLSEPGAGRRKEGVTEGVVLGPPSAVGLGRRKARYGGPQGNARAWEPRVSGVAGFAASGRVDRPALQRRPGSPDGSQCPRVSGVAACLASGRVDRPALRRRPGSPHANRRRGTGLVRGTPTPSPRPRPRKQRSFQWFGILHTLSMEGNIRSYCHCKIIFIARTLRSIIYFIANTATLKIFSACGAQKERTGSVVPRCSSEDSRRKAGGIVCLGVPSRGVGRQKEPQGGSNYPSPPGALGDGR